MGFKETRNFRGPELAERGTQKSQTPSQKPLCKAMFNVCHGPCTDNCSNCFRLSCQGSGLENPHPQLLYIIGPEETKQIPRPCTDHSQPPEPNTQNLPIARASTVTMFVGSVDLAAWDWGPGDFLDVDCSTRVVSGSNRGLKNQNGLRAVYFLSSACRYCGGILLVVLSAAS